MEIGNIYFVFLLNTLSTLSWINSVPKVIFELYILSSWLIYKTKSLFND